MVKCLIAIDYYYYNHVIFVLMQHVLLYISLHVCYLKKITNTYKRSVRILHTFYRPMCYTCILMTHEYHYYHGK